MIGSKPNANCNAQAPGASRQSRTSIRVIEAYMNLMTRSLGLLTFSAGVLRVNCTNPRGAPHAQTADRGAATNSGETVQAKIARAMSAGPAEVAKSARILDTDGNRTVVLREGNNGFTCMPGNPRV